MLMCGNPPKLKLLSKVVVMGGGCLQVTPTTNFGAPTTDYFMPAISLLSNQDGRFQVSVV